MATEGALIAKESGRRGGIREWANSVTMAVGSLCPQSGTKPVAPAKKKNVFETGEGSVTVRRCSGSGKWR